MYKAIDKKSNDKTVAVKIQSLEGNQKFIIDDEYRILRDYADHPNLPNFYGVYRKKKAGASDEIWFVIEVRKLFALLQLFVNVFYFCSTVKVAPLSILLNVCKRRIGVFPKSISLTS